MPAEGRDGGLGDPALHPDLEPLAFLLGEWRGEGAGEYPTIDPFRYGEEMRFEHVGDSFLLYMQRSWLLDDETPLHFERGFLRPGESGRVELTLAHPLGLVEVAEGTLRASPTGGGIHVASTTIAATTTGDPVTALERRIEVARGTLRYELLMQMPEVPMARHLVAELRRR